MTFLQALFLAIVQGITEPFPISSLGHAVLLPGLLHWSLDEHEPFFLPFLTMLHLGTLVALSGLFWKEWVGIFRGLLNLEGTREREDAIRLCLLLIIATLPAVFIGGLFEHYFRTIFASPLIVAGLLILNGFLLIITERSCKNTPERLLQNLADLGALDALIIGFWQCLALFPGLSRSGATINGGLMRGLSHWNAARFSLLLAQPIILAATLRETWQLRHVPLSQTIIIQSLLSAVAAASTALFCSAFLLHFFRRHDRQALTPFGIYCILAGIGAGICLLFT